MKLIKPRNIGACEFVAEKVFSTTGKGIIDQIKDTKPVEYDTFTMKDLESFIGQISKGWESTIKERWFLMSGKNIKNYSTEDFENLNNNNLYFVKL